ncbi:MAG: tetratricopeptide repeat protein [Candidatus Wallbacteria bacterium]|nr:tetratricopeptide repeat protein [Candidatus Wallbacteria bacterium]
MKQLLFAATLAAITMAMLGCGADPGGEFVNGDFTNNVAPIVGASGKITQAYGLFKQGNFSGAAQVFNQVLADNPIAGERAEALAGLGFSNVRLKGSSNGIANFEEALKVDSRNADARVGLGGALISRGSSDDIRRAIDALQGISPGNPEFRFVDQYGIGIADAEVHALLAYALFVNGDRSASASQAALARSRDSANANTSVDQILKVLGFIP